MFSFPTRPDGSWPSAFKKLTGLQRGVGGARAISFAAIPFSRSSSHLWRRHLHGRRCLALSPEGEDRCQICADKFPIQGTLANRPPRAAALARAKGGGDSAAGCARNSGKKFSHPG